MRSFATIVVLLFVAAALAGCAQNPGGATTPEGLTLNREVDVHVDDANKDAKDPYQAITASFVVRVGATPLTPSAASITYQDRNGTTVTKALSAFTGATTLTQGAEVRIDDANLTSDASLSLDGKTVATRARPDVSWWTVGGAPTGFRMDPGSALSFLLTANANESIGLKDVEPTSADLPYKLDALTATLGFDYGATMNLTMGTDLDWTLHGYAGVPMSLEGTIVNTTSQQPITGGVELLPGEVGTVDVSGKVHFNGSEPTSSDVTGGKTTTDASVIAWLSGHDDLIDQAHFSCAGKTKQDACHPTEWPQDKLHQTTDIPASHTEAPRQETPMSPTDLANLTRLLSEDLVPGDALVVSFDLTQDKAHFTGTASIRAVDDEKVTVPAGAFDATKVVERFDGRFDVPEQKDGNGAVVTKAFSIDQRFVDITYWLAKGSFVPLRVEQTTPFDLNKVVHDVINATPDETWKETAIKPLTASNVDFTLDAKTVLELQSMQGTAAFSPWTVIGGFQGVALAPSIWGAELGAGAGAGYLGFGALGRSMTSPPTMTPPPAPEQPAVSLAITSAGPIEHTDAGESKTYTVASASGGLTYDRLAMTLDHAALDASADPPGWCVLDASRACDLNATYGGDVRQGDSFRISSTEPLAGKTLRILDAYSGSTILTLTVG